MPSFVKFEDVASAIKAGADLEMAADQLFTDVQRVTGGAGSIHEQNDVVLKGTDKYSTDFKKGYEKDGKELTTTANQFVGDILVFGKDVRHAATTLMGVDVANGANLAQSSAGKA
jgi:hypothetical protein